MLHLITSIWKLSLCIPACANSHTLMFTSEYPSSVSKMYIHVYNVDLLLYVSVQIAPPIQEHEHYSFLYLWPLLYTMDVQKHICFH